MTQPDALIARLLQRITELEIENADLKREVHALKMVAAVKVDPNDWGAALNGHD